MVLLLGAELQRLKIYIRKRIEKKKKLATEEINVMPVEKF